MIDDTPPVPEWPLFGLRLVHDDLELRIVRDTDAVALGRILHTVLPPERAHHLPNVSLLAVADTIEETVRRSLQYQWGLRASLTPTRWALPFAVLHRGVVVGGQDLRAEAFATLREVDSGSYLAPRARRQGIGTRMRAMVLHLAFAHLGALTATSSYIDGNDGSAGVSGRLGYEPDGVRYLEFRDRRLLDHQVRLGAKRWAVTRPTWLDDVRVDGLGPALRLLGLDAPATQAAGD